LQSNLIDVASKQTEEQSDGAAAARMPAESVVAGASKTRLTMMSDGSGADALSGRDVTPCARI